MVYQIRLCVREKAVDKAQGEKGVAQQIKHGLPQQCIAGWGRACSGGLLRRRSLTTVGQDAYILRQAFA